MKRYCINLISLLAVLFVSACTINPVTGEQEFTLLSPQQEIALGQQNYGPSQQSQGGLYAVDPTLSIYINLVGQKLARVSDNPDLPYEFVVINNDVPNAWALPGGKIAINRGLLLHLEDEAQLAAVLGHEIVHAAARHSARQMTQNALLGLGVAVLGELNRDSEYVGLINGGASIGAAAWQSRYGRENELEADDYGMIYMARAGYDPVAAIELQEIFVSLNKSREPNFLAGLFASHPPSQARVEANRRHAKELNGNVRNREEYQRAIQQIKRDKPAYDLQQQAIEAAGNKNVQRALSLINQATDRQGQEHLFWETKGHIQRLAEDMNGARQSYSRSIALYSGYFRPYLSRGALFLQDKNFILAEQDLLASERRLPTQTTSYLLGQATLGLGKRNDAIQHFQRAAQAGGEVGKAAQTELQKLGAMQQLN